MNVLSRLAIPLAAFVVVAAPVLALENNAGLAEPALLGTVAAAVVAPVCRLDSPWPIKGWAWVCQV